MKPAAIVAAATIAVVIAVLPLTACSSAPEPTGEVTTLRRQAERNIAHGYEALYQGRVREAELFFETALNQYRRLDDRSGIADGFAALGRTRTVAGDLVTAADYLREAAVQAEEAAARPRAVEYYAALAETELRRDRRGPAEQALQASTRILEEHPNDAARAVNLHSAAVLTASAGRLQEAEDYLREALELNREGRRYRELAANHYMMASVLSRRELYETALEHAAAALETDKLIENSVGIAQDLIALGRISYRAGDRTAARHYYERASSVYIGLQDENGLRRAQALLAELEHPEERSR